MIYNGYLLKRIEEILPYPEIDAALLQEGLKNERWVILDDLLFFIFDLYQIHRNKIIIPKKLKIWNKNFSAYRLDFTTGFMLILTFQIVGIRR